MDRNRFSEEGRNASEQDITFSEAQQDRIKNILKKRRKTMGVIAFCMAFLSLLLIAAIGIYGFVRFRNGALAGTDISIFSAAITASAVLAGLALIVAVITLFVRRQRKGFAVSALLIALVVLLVCVGAMYAYQYIFSDLNHDEIFNSLTEDDLNVVQINHGEVIRETETPESTISIEELEEQAKQLEVEWEHLTDESIPEEALAKMDTGAPEGPSYLLEGADQITNFMLFGTDVGGASDCNILLSLDRVHHKIKMISLARDSYVMMPQWGSYSKLAYPYVWGGPQLAVRTINYNYSMNVTDYISVDFDQLTEIINLLDGIDVELSEVDSWRYNSHMDGEQALTYSRDRSDNEINRTGRQRNVVLAIMDKVRQMKLTEYPAFIRSCFGMCTTSFTTSDLMELCMEVAQSNYSFESYAVLENVDYWGGILGEAQYFYCVYDLNRASDWIYRTVYEDLYYSGYADPVPAPSEATEDS